MSIQIACNLDHDSDLSYLLSSELKSSSGFEACEECGRIFSKGESYIVKTFGEEDIDCWDDSWTEPEELPISSCTDCAHKTDCEEGYYSVENFQTISCLECDHDAALFTQVGGSVTYHPQGRSIVRSVYDHLSNLDRTEEEREHVRFVIWKLLVPLKRRIRNNSKSVDARRIRWVLRVYGSDDSEGADRVFYYESDKGSRLQDRRKELDELHKSYTVEDLGEE